MRYSQVVLLGVVCAAGLCGCSNNNNNPPRATNAIGEDVSNQPPLASLDKISPETRYAAGQLAESRGDFTGAIQQYNAALKLDPHHQNSLFRMGVLYTESKQYPKAIEIWREFIRVTNGSAVAYSNAAFCYQMAGKTREAEECYLLGIKKDPTNQPCRVNYGLMLARIGREKDAIEQLSAVLRAPDVHYNLASVYEQMGRKEDARNEYERALELNPNFSEARLRLQGLSNVSDP